MFYRNKVTDEVYRHLAIATDQSQGRENIFVTVYCPDDDEHTIYVCESNEFDKNFEILGG